jgi:glutaminyl-peptide cyclotransferase
MKKFLSFLICICICICLAHSKSVGLTNAQSTLMVLPKAQPKPIQFTIVGQTPHDASAFTQGLLIYHEPSSQDFVYYESTGLYGKSSLRQVHSSGEVKNNIPVPAPYFAEGLALRNDTLFQLTWRENTIFYYDRASLSYIHSAYWPKEGWGLGVYQNHFVLSDGSDTLHFLQIQNAKWQLVQKIAVAQGNHPITRLNEIEVIGDYILCNIWQSDSIAVVYPGSGQIKGYIDLSAIAQKVRSTFAQAEVLNGIAWNPKDKTLHVTGKLWPTIYVLKVPILEKF